MLDHAGLDPGPGEQHRDADQLLPHLARVVDAVVLGEGLAVVAGEEQHAVVEPLPRLELGDEAAHAATHVDHPAAVQGLEIADDAIRQGEASGDVAIHAMALKNRGSIEYAAPT